MKDRIKSVLNEDRVFEPPAEFSAQAHVGSMQAYEQMYRRSIEDPEGFWREQGEQLIPWSKPFDQVLEWNEPFAKWFLGGETTASVACVDKHLDGPDRDKAAIIWEGEPGDVRTLTYQQLHDAVCAFAGALRARGVAVTVADIAETVRPISGVRYFQVDVRTPIDEPDLASGPDTVIYNLAAVHRTPGHESHEYFDTNVEGARNIAAFAERTGARRIGDFGEDLIRNAEFICNGA